MDVFTAEVDGGCLPLMWIVDVFTAVVDVFTADVDSGCVYS